MVTKHDYVKSEVNACLSVPVELMTILGEFRDSIVLVGGWIPYFLLENSRNEHVGSLDIDIALDFQKRKRKRYLKVMIKYGKKNQVENRAGSSKADPIKSLSQGLRYVCIC